MKATVKALFTSRLAYCALAFILAVAACVGIHNYAWADEEDDAIIAEWNKVSPEGANSTNGLITLKAWNYEMVEGAITVHITNGRYPVPPSIVYLYTDSGAFVSGVFRETLPPVGNSAQINIQTNIPASSFTSAKLYRAVFVTYETELGKTPAPQTVVKNSAITLPDLVNTDDKEFLGWIEKGSDSTEPLTGEYKAKNDVTLVAVWKTIETPAPETPETPDPDGEVTEGPESNASEAGPTIPQTGDNQNAALAICGFGATALLAAAAFVATRRKGLMR